MFRLDTSHSYYWVNSPGLRLHRNSESLNLMIRVRPDQSTAYHVRLLHPAGFWLHPCPAGHSADADAADTFKSLFYTEQTTVQPGSRVNLGIKFVTDSGWHIYWRNPGDSGEPPRIQWRLPAGATAETLQWPVPTRLKNPAGTDYGYEGTVILLTALQIPPRPNPVPLLR